LIVFHYQAGRLDRQALVRQLTWASVSDACDICSVLSATLNRSHDRSLRISWGACHLQIIKTNIGQHKNSWLMEMVASLIDKKGATCFWVNG
jgi:hypothetical protein